MKIIISVIIPTFRRAELLSRCLSALAAQSLNFNLFEIIVCDDGVTNETERVVKKASEETGLTLRYIPVAGTRGPAAARNRGASVARGAVLAFTDDDCIPHPEWLSRALEIFANEEVSALTGKIVVPRRDPPTDYEKNEAGLERSEFVTANVFIRKDLFWKVGGFSEGFETAWREDSELHFRLLKEEVEIWYRPDMVVYHPVRPEGFGISLRQQKKCRFEALLYKLHPDLYRAKIGRFAPVDYYLFLIGWGIAIYGVIAGSIQAALPGMAIAITCWLLILVRRVSGTARDPLHLFEMALTSALLPALSIYWRARGGAEQRVVFF